MPCSRVHTWCIIIMDLTTIYIIILGILANHSTIDCTTKLPTKNERGSGEGEGGEGQSTKPKISSKEEMGNAERLDQWYQKILQSLIIKFGGVKTIRNLEKLAVMESDHQFRQVFLSSKYFSNAQKTIQLAAQYARTLSMMECAKIHFNNASVYERQLQYMNLEESVQLLKEIFTCQPNFTNILKTIENVFNGWYLDKGQNCCAIICNLCGMASRLADSLAKVSMYYETLDMEVTLDEIHTRITYVIDCNDTAPICIRLHSPSVHNEESF